LFLQILSEKEEKRETDREEMRRGEEMKRNRNSFWGNEN
jgi:hypothetical protein